MIARPGVTRRFGIVCTNAASVRVGTPPGAGTITRFAPSSDFVEGQLWVDATYVPGGASEDPDPFTVVAADGAGNEVEAQMEIVPRPVSFNGGGGCTIPSATTPPDVPVELELTCRDDQGDPLSAAIHRAPGHGTAGPPELAPAPYGGAAFHDNHVWIEKA